MLRCLHINNWFDISQSLRLPAIGLIFPERWNHFLLLVSFWLYRFLFLLLPYHFNPFTAGLSHTIFLCVCVCVHIFMCIFPSMNLQSKSQSVYMHIFMCHQFQCVFWCIVPFYQFLLVHTCAYAIHICRIPIYCVEMPMSIDLLFLRALLFSLPPNTHKHRSHPSEVEFGH